MTSESQNVEWKQSWQDECLGSMTQMRVYDNRLTLWNAGVFPEELPVEKLFQSHESFPRNSLIAEACYKAGYIDSWGRGVEKITEACQKAGLPDPTFIERSGGVVVELRRDLERIGITERSIQRNIQKLQADGFLRRGGGRKEGYWEVINEAI